MDKIELANFYDFDLKKQVVITISDYLTFLQNQKKDDIAYFIFNRLYSRYIQPFRYDNDEYKSKYKNGFSIMASQCLLIETIYSFKNGWGTSNKKSEETFSNFFKNNPFFSELNNKGNEIYKNVRCGILHQGETTGGWKITREGITLFDSTSKTLDAIIFSDRMENCLKTYRDELRTVDWDSETWDNFRVKMRKVINNCKQN